MNINLINEMRGSLQINSNGADVLSKYGYTILNENNIKYKYLNFSK